MPLHCVPRILLVVTLACPTATIATPHPLDGLDLDEHRRAIALLDAAGGLDGETVVADMHLIEPPKAEVIAAAPGAPLGRRALVVLRRAGRVFEATVDLVGGEVRLDEVPGAQSQFTDRDYTIAADTALASAQVQALLAAHGVADPATVDCFAAGSAIAVPEAARTMRVRCAERRGARSVAARVLEGIDVLVDVDAARWLHAAMRALGAHGRGCRSGCGGDRPGPRAAAAGHGAGACGPRLHDRRRPGALGRVALPSADGSARGRGAVDGEHR